jgi:predicted NBD/HSP70 family sugar kinase
VASQGAIVRQAQAVFVNRPASLLHSFAADVSAVDLEAVLRAHRSGCKEMTEIEARAGRHLGLAAAHLVAALNIPLVVLSGSVARFGEPLVNSIQSGLEASLLPSLAKQTKVKLSVLGEDVVMLGAAALLLSNELGVI